MQDVIDFTQNQGGLPVNMFTSRGKLTVVAPDAGDGATEHRDHHWRRHFGDPREHAG